MGARTNAATRWSALLIAGVAAVGLVGCSSGEGDAKGNRTIDAQGTQVSIPDHPERIVATFNGVTQALIEAGGADRIVAAQELPIASVPPANRAGYEKIGKKIEMTASAESLTSLNPDLFASVNDDEVPNADYKKIAPVVIFQTFGKQRFDWQARSVVAGEILGTQDKVKELSEALAKRQADIKTKYADVLAKNTFTYLDSIEQGNLYAVGAKAMLGQLLTPAGIRFAPSVSGPGPKTDTNPGEFQAPLDQLGTYLDSNIILTGSNFDGVQTQLQQDLLKNPLIADSGKIIQPIGLVQISSYAQANYILDRVEKALQAAKDKK
ncbi:MAG: ABC transporter substrate-binding protein [Gordonia sp. (in: high G+C Gram-positive bacteria)]